MDYEFYSVIRTIIKTFVVIGFFVLVSFLSEISKLNRYEKYVPLNARTGIFPKLVHVSWFVIIALSLHLIFKFLFNGEDPTSIYMIGGPIFLAILSFSLLEYLNYSAKYFDNYLYSEQLNELLIDLLENKDRITHQKILNYKEDSKYKKESIKEAYSMASTYATKLLEAPTTRTQASSNSPFTHNQNDYDFSKKLNELLM